MLLSVLLSGCVASSYGLTEQKQAAAIKKYPRTGLNLQPDDGFFAISGKVLARTIYWPLTLGISELILQKEREASFSSYAIDLQKEKYDKEVLPRIKYRFDSFLGEDMNYAVLHMGKPTATKRQRIAKY